MTCKPAPSSLRRAQRLLPQGLAKCLQRKGGLIEGHLVPGGKDAQEAQSARRLEGAGRGAADRVVGQLHGAEGGLLRVCDGVDGPLRAVPVADPVGVAGPDQDADARLDDG